jgi:hypothetical protein
MNASPIILELSRMQHARPCSFCGEADHVEWHCPELVAPIRDQGMMKPPAGTPMSGGDDDCSRCLIRKASEHPDSRTDVYGCDINTLLPELTFSRPTVKRIFKIRLPAQWDQPKKLEPYAARCRQVTGRFNQDT